MSQDDPLERIAAALERMRPAPMAAPDFDAADAFVWHVEPDRLEPVAEVNRVEMDLLVGIDRSRDTLLANTLQFARGLPANNALLWGARGMGKSSLVKAVHERGVSSEWLFHFYRQALGTLRTSDGAANEPLLSTTEVRDMVVHLTDAGRERIDRACAGQQHWS